MSSSVWRSNPRWIASSGRWKSRHSQFSTSFRLGLSYPDGACGSSADGTTADERMWLGIDSSQALYASEYSPGEGVSSLITLPSDRSVLRTDRLGRAA